MFDLISIGDSTIDNFVQIHDAEVKCDLNKLKCMLCVEYGDKISVDKLTHCVAGNAANSAVGGARLKLLSSIYTNVGSDPSGRQILEKFKDENVDTRYVVANKDMESNLSTVLSFKGERTIFVYHQKWVYKLPELDRSRWVYFTSLGSSFTESNLLNELSSYLERTGSKMLYSPGTYQIKQGVKKNPRLLSLSEVFIVNLEEAKEIVGESPIKKLLEKLVNLGPKMVVITDALKGAYAYDGVNFYHIDPFPAKLIESTGAGDAFATGLLGGLFYKNDLAESLRWGAANGASVVEQIGPQAGLLTYERMQGKLKEYSKIKAKEL